MKINKTKKGKTICIWFGKDNPDIDVYHNGKLWKPKKWQHLVIILKPTPSKYKI
jgi:hypothetical protein